MSMIVIDDLHHLPSKITDRQGNFNENHFFLSCSIFQTSIITWWCNRSARFISTRKSSIRKFRSSTSYLYESPRKYNSTSINQIFQKINYHLFFVQQNTHYDLNPDRVPAMDIPASARALSTRLPDSVRPAIILDGNSGFTAREPIPSSISSPIDEFQLAWLKTGNHQDSLEKVAADERNERRKQELMTEQVLSDQLSHYVLCDLEQEYDRHKPFIMQQQPRRNLDRRMHNTR